jgi:hypothetical protein
MLGAWDIPLLLYSAMSIDTSRIMNAARRSRGTSQEADRFVWTRT